MQKYNYDVNNELIDQILKEDDVKRKELLIEKLKVDSRIDFTSTGYAAQLFSIFKNISYFFFKESKQTECIICGKKTDVILKELQPFIYINNTHLKEKNLFNILLL